ncbi:velvet factor, partial [Phlyctochytrium arcticum]
VRQEPNRARMCGFGTKDYRPVDPAPILQLVRREGDGISPDFKQCTTLICHASLWSADGTEERGVVLNPGSATARRTEALFAGTTSDHGVSNLSTLSPSNYVSVLVGSLVSPCHILTDVDGHKALFFTFADLSIRTGGQYRLKFFLYDITRDASNAIASAMSNVIAVYPPKTFPGMTESSQLAKCLARQGIKLHIRTD